MQLFPLFPLPYRKLIKLLDGHYIYWIQCVRCVLDG